MDKIKREAEKRFLKQKIKEMAAELGMSVRKIKKEIPKLIGKGYKYRIPKPLEEKTLIEVLFKGRERKGKKASLRQRYTYLKDFSVFAKEFDENMKAEIERIKAEQEAAKEDKENENV